jgi:hypothetical protein
MPVESIALTIDLGAEDEERFELTKRMLKRFIFQKSVTDIDQGTTD